MSYHGVRGRECGKGCIRLGAEMKETTTLWRPVGRAEYDLLLESGMRRWPPRLAHQPIFYPVLNRGYAAQIARDWNTNDEVSGFIGIVTEFEVETDYVVRFDRKVVGEDHHSELWVLAADLDEFNDHIVGEIRVVDVFTGDRYDGALVTPDGLKDQARVLELAWTAFLVRRQDIVAWADLLARARAHVLRARSARRPLRAVGPR